MARDELTNGMIDDCGHYTGIETKSCPRGIEDSEELSPEQVKKNMLYCIMLDTIWTTGWADFVVAMSPLLAYLNASNTVIGLVNGTTIAGLFGMFVSPWISRRFRVKKWYLIAVNIPYIGALGICGLGIVMSHRLGLHDPTLLKFVVGIILVHMFCAGFVALPHQEYVAACIPMSHRGRLSGLSISLGFALSIASSAIGTIILFKVAKPMAFGYLFMMTWAICQGGYIFAFFAKEKPTPVEKAPPPWSKAMLKAAWEDKPYVRFLTMQSVNMVFCGGMGGFALIYGFRELKMIWAASGLINMIGTAARTGTAAPFGFLVDKYGAKRVIPFALISGPITYSLLVFWHNPISVYVSMTLGTIGGLLFCTACSVLLYGLPKPENRSGHYTIQLMANYGCGFLATVLAGFLCDKVGYHHAFQIGLVTSTLFIPLTVYLLSVLSDDVKAYS